MMLQQMESMVALIAQGLLTGDGLVQPNFKFTGANTGTYAFHQTL